MLQCRIRSITPPGGVVGAAPSVEVLAGSAEPPPVTTLLSGLKEVLKWKWQQLSIILSGEVLVRTPRFTEFKPQDLNREKRRRKKEKCSHTNIRRICSQMHPFQQLLLSFDASCSPFLVALQQRTLARSFSTFGCLIFSDLLGF